MKPHLFAPLCAMVLACGTVQAGSEAQATGNRCADGSAKVWVTGSAIKRCVRIFGNGSVDSPSPVLIIGRRDIDRSGRNTVADVLKSYPPLR